MAGALGRAEVEKKGGLRGGLQNYGMEHGQRFTLLRFVSLGIASWR